MSITTTTTIRGTIPWKAPVKRTLSPNAMESASRITNLDPNSTSQAQKKRVKVIRAPDHLLKNWATRCSMATVNFRRTCNSTEANNDTVNVEIVTLSQYSANRFRTTRSIRVPVKYRTNSR